MPIAFTCGACRERVSVSRKWAGKRGLCPSCKQPTDVPGAVPAPGVDLSASDEQPSAALAIERAKLAMERKALERAQRESAKDAEANEAMIAGALAGADELRRGREELARERAELERERAALASADVDCPACGESIKRVAKLCRHCKHVIGEPIGPPREERPRTVVIQGGASPGTCAALSFILPGLGHMVAGHGCAGLIVMAGAPLLGFACFGLAGLMRDPGPAFLLWPCAPVLLHFVQVWGASAAARRTQRAAREEAEGWSGRGG